MNVHPNWMRDRWLPRDMVRCPKCGTLRTHRVNSWWWDDLAGTWRCRTGTCRKATRTME